MTYARDELARCQRLVKANEDNRSALLRAAGLDELLLKARLLRLWHAGQINLWDRDEFDLGDCGSLPNDLQNKLCAALVQHQGTDHMRNALKGIHVYDKGLGRNVPAFVKLDVWRGSYRARPTSEVPSLADYGEGAGLTGETLTQLRNRAIHTYLYVTQPIAQAAVELAGANLEDFEDNWAHFSGPLERIEPKDVKQLPWAKVCQLCSLGFLPLTPQRKGDV